MTIKDKYIKLLADSITVSVEDLSPNELAIITKSFELWEEKMEEIKLANDEIKILFIKLANLKSSLDDSNYHFDDDHSEPEQSEHDKDK